MSHICSFRSFEHCASVSLWVRGQCCCESSCQLAALFAGINCKHMVCWQNHSIFSVHEVHIHHSAAFITQEFLLHSFRWNFVYTQTALYLQPIQTQRINAEVLCCIQQSKVIHACVWMCYFWANSSLQMDNQYYCLVQLFPPCGPEQMSFQQHLKLWWRLSHYCS